MVRAPLFLLMNRERSVYRHLVSVYTCLYTLDLSYSYIYLLALTVLLQIHLQVKLHFIKLIRESIVGKERKKEE